jgi:hypothetical protein
VLLVAVIDLGVVYLRGREIGSTRGHLVEEWYVGEMSSVGHRLVRVPAGSIPPWEWNTEEWRETLWPWK